MSPALHGLLLAAGAGRRYGGPKALARDPDGTSWLLRAVASLRPCRPITVVLGAEAEAAAALLPMSVNRVLAVDWAAGMGASLRAGLGHLLETDPDSTAALVTLVDLPDVTAEVVLRLREAVAVAPAEGADQVLARASYDGVPGHPVVLGRAHWAGVIDAARGDRGARDYLMTQRDRVVLVECGDLATGVDQDE